MNISLDIPVGKYRSLTSKELTELYRLLGESTKTEEGSILRETPEEKKQISHKPVAKNPKKPAHPDRKKENFKKNGRRKRES